MDFVNLILLENPLLLSANLCYIIMEIKKGVIR